MFTLPELPFATNALEPFIDTQTMEIHHGKHHAAYVKNLNEVLPDVSDSDLLKTLRNLSDLPELIRNKVRNNGGGHYNHSLFWQMLAPATGQLPEGKLLEAINSTFGNLDGFKEKFAAAALSRFGSGWVWLTKDLKIVDSPNQDLPEGTPILGLDVWEHAYYLKYQNRRADYVTAWWNVINWPFVCARFESGQS